MSKHTLYTGIAVTVTLVVVGVFFIIGMPFSVNTLSTATMGQTAAAQLAVQEQVQGTGAVAKPGDRIVVNYTGRLQDGTVFDSSVGRAPYTFVLGAGEVIAGWDQGLVGVQAGSKRTLVIPPQLGYGASDYGPIPGNSTLIFEVEVLRVEPAQ